MSMKLYNLSRGMWFVFQGRKLQFVKPDGMFGICRDEIGAETYLMMAADVEVSK